GRELSDAVQQDHPDLVVPGAGQEDEDQAGRVPRRAATDVGPVLVGGVGLLPLLEAQGFDFFTGVPCSLIEELIGALESHPRVAAGTAAADDVAWAASEMDARSSPVALLIPPGVDGGAPRSPGEAATTPAEAGARAEPSSTGPDVLRPRISRRAALETVIKKLDGEPAIH